MTRSKKKKRRMNLTVDEDFYNHLKQVAVNEHLPVSTFVKKYLMDNMLEDGIVRGKLN